MSALTLSPQMMSFPKFIRKSEQSTRGLDGAFPPFKIEHRYKSVYERAGFDVNRGGNNNNSDSKSMTSRKTSRNHSQSNFGNPNESNTRLQDQSPSSSSYQNTPVLQKNRIPSLASGGANTRNNSPTASSTQANPHQSIQISPTQNQLVLILLLEILMNSVLFLINL